MPMTEQDGNIVAARSKLADAIHKLIDPRPVPLFYENGKTDMAWLDSRYLELAAAVGGDNMSEKGDSRQGRLPIRVDAVDLLRVIDVTVAVWHPKAPSPELMKPEPVTVRRLKKIDTETYRPQDTSMVMQRMRKVEGWVEQIKHLLDPEAIKHISAPCPACGQSTVWRRDSSGEVVRQAALQIVTNQGCTCLACRTFWEPGKYMFLCRLLGFDLPEGVLE